MDGELKDETVRDFCAIVARKYRYWCARNGERETPEGLLQYAVDIGVIRERTVVHYMMMELYPAALYSSGSKEEAIEKISDKTGMPTRTIRHLINNPCRFTPPAK
jgi:hypothetical protein